MGRRKIDMRGKTFGNLKVVSEGLPGHHKESRWVCRCKCGNEVLIPGSQLRNGHYTSCGNCLRYVSFGNSMKGIDHHGVSFLFDKDDYEAVKRFRWWVNNHGYVCADDANRHRIWLHRLVMQNPDGKLIDHINGDRTDCRKSNLRVATAKQNSRNSTCERKHNAGYKGVYFDSARGKYEAHIRPNGRKIHLGRFATAREAALAYNRAAVVYFGEFANINKEVVQ